MSDLKDSPVPESSRRRRTPLALARRVGFTTAVSLAALPGMTRPAAAAVNVNNQQPPGVAGFQQILNWGGWIVTVIGVVGMLAVGATMILQHRRGEGGEHIAKLGMVLAGLVVAVAAGPIVNQLDA